MWSAPSFSGLSFSAPSGRSPTPFEFEAAAAAVVLTVDYSLSTSAGGFWPLTLAV